MDGREGGGMGWYGVGAALEAWHDTLSTTLCQKRDSNTFPYLIATDFDSYLHSDGFGRDRSTNK